MAKRPPLPAELERAVLVESGHRCAIPTCRQAPVEIAHITPWSKRKEHAFDNLIALCPTCHTRYDKGEIDRKSMHAYQLNLVLVSSRYGDLEQRLIRMFVKDRSRQEVWLMAEFEILLSYLLEDGLVEGTGQVKQVDGIPKRLYRLTRLGRDYIARFPRD